MPATASPMTTGLDTVHYHLKRAVELLQEIRAEQIGMPETHILENLAILDVDTAASVDRLTGLISEMRNKAA